MPITAMTVINKEATVPRSFAFETKKELARKRFSVAFRKRSCPEAQIYKILQRFEPTIRRAILARRLSESQRLALEQWILSQRAVTKDTPATIGSAAVTATAAVAVQPPALPDSTRRPQSGIHGIHVRVKSGRISYCASTSLGQLIVSTSYISDLGRVLVFRQALLAIRSAVGNIARYSSHTEEIFRRALVDEPQLLGLDGALDMHLCFSVVIAARYWVGSALKTPQFKVVSQLEAGIGAWQRLSEARSCIYHGRTNRYTILWRHSPAELASAWFRLRRAYEDAFVEAGYCRTRVAARLRSLEEKHRSYHQRLEARWHSLQRSSNGNLFPADECQNGLPTASAEVPCGAFPCWEMFPNKRGTHVAVLSKSIRAGVATTVDECIQSAFGNDHFSSVAAVRRELNCERRVLADKGSSAIVGLERQLRHVLSRWQRRGARDEASELLTSFTCGRQLKLRNTSHKRSSMRKAQPHRREASARLAPSNGRKRSAFPRLDSMFQEWQPSDSTAARRFKCKRLIDLLV